MRLARALPDERAALLAQTDPELRREVESLSADRTGGEFLDRPAIQNAPNCWTDSTVTALAPGACLGPYRIESKLGEGGMGEVFRAVDTRLGRAVAIKITREQFNARFEREARAISSLNHPNICTLHDVGPNYLVMELVEGETLAARLKSGPLPLQTALLYAVADRGRAGRGSRQGHHSPRSQARQHHAREDPGSRFWISDWRARSQDETVTASRMMMGTPAYMAPEQREGKPADARTDIYAFGCVLYEMLTGARVGPQRKRIRPRKLEKIVNRCLEEDPGRRWQSAAELQRELAAVMQPGRADAPGCGRRGDPWHCAQPATFTCTGHRNLPRRTRLFCANLRTRPAIRCSTRRFARAWRCNWNSPRSSLSSLTNSIQQVLRLMNRRSETRLTPEVAREVCERTGGAAVLEGSIAAWETSTSCGCAPGTAAPVKSSHKNRRRPGQERRVLNALSRIAIQIRTRLGESLATIQEHSTPLEQATTPSLEALKAYSAGAERRFTLMVTAAAIPHFQRAIAIDPQFAMAYAGSRLSFTGTWAKPIWPPSTPAKPMHFGTASATGKGSGSFFSTTGR